MNDAQHRSYVRRNENGDGEMGIWSEHVPVLKDAAQLLSQRLGVRLNFAHTLFLHASAANAGALEMVSGKWEGHYDEPAVLDAIADFVEDYGGQDFLDGLLDDPEFAEMERMYEADQRFT